MAQPIHFCGNSFNLDKILSRHKSGEAKKPRETYGSAEGHTQSERVRRRVPPNFDVVDKRRASADKQAAGPLTDEMKKVAQSVANLHYGDFPKHQHK